MGLFSVKPSETSKVNLSSPELLFLQALCSVNADQAISFFEENSQFGGASVVDAPQGRYAGKAAIRKFAENWLQDFEAVSAEIEPLTQTIGSGRSASEVIVHFNRNAGDVSIPMFIIGDLRPDCKLDEVRIYFYYGWVKGFSAYRRIIFKPEHQEPAPYPMMTGSVRRYFELLHGQEDVNRRVEEIVALTTPDATFGGYRPEWIEPADAGHEAFRNHYVGICADAPENFIVRAEALTDDGVRCVVEWTLVVTEKGYSAGHVAQSGVAVYERDPKTGLLCSIRICDNVGMADDIALDELPEEVRPLVAAYRAKAGKQ